MVKHITAITYKVLQKYTFLVESMILHPTIMTPCSSRFFSFNFDASISESDFDRLKSRAISFT